MHSQPNNVKFRYLLLDIGFRLILSILFAHHQWCL